LALQLRAGRAVKSENIFKRTHNRWLRRLAALKVGAEIGSEPFWAGELGVSRTTIRKVLQGLTALKIVVARDTRKTLARHPRAPDFYPEAETQEIGDFVEKQFMHWILHGDCKPGDQINGLDLARQFGVSVSAVRDYLKRFSQFGLLEKRPSGSWMFKGFTEDFAEELFEVRFMFEMRSAQRFVELAPNDPRWSELNRIRAEHVALLAQAETRYRDFCELDERLHRLIHNASRNRFIVSFYDVISIIFHYHYQWNKGDEKARNIAAVREHLDYIDALQSRDAARASQSCRDHMTTARRTLIDAIPRLQRGAPARRLAPKQSDVATGASRS
jgi:DNA-binding GntR family transcriptional regulator